MEVTFRRSTVPTMVIPKGTLLFRISKDPDSDFRGVLLPSGKRCLTPSYAVYFHPNPFVGFKMYSTDFKEIGNEVGIYVLNHDITVIRLVTPSPFSRMDRKKKGSFLKPCSTMRKGCLPRKGNTYDTCLSTTMMKKYPIVVGMLSIAGGDIKYFKKASHKFTAKIRKTFHFAKDSVGMTMIPELAIHPLKTRPDHDILSEESDKLETNYSLLSREPYNEAKLHSFMDTHAVYNPDTFFYTYKE